MNSNLDFGPEMPDDPADLHKTIKQTRLQKCVSTIRSFLADCSPEEKYEIYRAIGDIDYDLGGQVIIYTSLYNLKKVSANEIEEIKREGLQYIVK